MADHSELKKLAEACGNLNWRFQQENWTEYAIRDDHGYIATMRVGSPKQAGPDPDREAKAKFLGAVAPGAVLALIAENEHLTESRNEAREERNKLGDRYDQLKAESDGNAKDFLAFGVVMRSQADKLKAEIAEIADLKTGYAAYEQVNAGLKAEVEALLAALKGMTAMYGYCWDIVDGGLLCMQDNVQRCEDAHEAAQKVIAAMGQGEQP